LARTAGPEKAVHRHEAVIDLRVLIERLENEIERLPRASGALDAVG